MSAEEQSLLPKSKGAPEIYGSRPPSLNNGTSSNEEEAAEWNSYRPRPSSRNWPATLSLGLLFVGLVVLLFSQSVDLPSKPKTIEERVYRILSDTPLIDGHNDLAVLIRVWFNNHIYDPEFAVPFEQGGLVGHVDLPRLEKGQNGGAFWSVYAPCPANVTDFSDENYAESVAFTLSQVDLVARLQSAYPDHFALPGNSTTAVSAFESGRLISPLGVEGLHQIGNSLANLRNYHSLGVRYATLTHNCHNKYADAALNEGPSGIKVAKPLWGGVSPAGQTLIQEMNRLGMIVDLAHVSVDTMRDVLGGSEGWSGSAAPIMFSHSSAYAVCPHPRNVPDDILHLVKKTNSIVMVNFAPDFVSCVANPDSESGLPDLYPPNSTLQHVAKHIMHIGNLIGYDHVGLGSDFDGIASVPDGLEDVSMFPALVAELLKHGVSDKEAGLVVGGNILRVWSDVEKVAQKLQKDGVKPAEDNPPPLTSPELQI